MSCAFWMFNPTRRLNSTAELWRRWRRGRIAIAPLVARRAGTTRLRLAGYQLAPLTHLPPGHGRLHGRLDYRQLGPAVGEP